MGREQCSCRSVGAGAVLSLQSSSCGLSARPPVYLSFLSCSSPLSCLSVCLPACLPNLSTSLPNLSVYIFIQFFVSPCCLSTYTVLVFYLVCIICDPDSFYVYMCICLCIVLYIHRSIYISIHILLSAKTIHPVILVWSIGIRSLSLSLGTWRVLGLRQFHSRPVIRRQIGHCCVHCSVVCSSTDHQSRVKKGPFNNGSKKNEDDKIEKIGFLFQKVRF